MKNEQIIKETTGTASRALTLLKAPVSCPMPAALRRAPRYQPNRADLVVLQWPSGHAV